MYIYWKFMLTGLFIALLTACGGNDQLDVALPDGLPSIWTSNCYQLDNGNYFYKIMTFADAKFSWVGVSFADAACSIAAMDGNSSAGAGTYTKGGIITTGAGVSAWEIEFIITTEDFHDKSEKLYDIFAINEGKLYFGKISYDFNRRTPESRPVELELNIHYTASRTTYP